jgi:hypothetical protein
LATHPRYILAAVHEFLSQNASSWERSDASAVGGKPDVGRQANAVEVLANRCN